MALDVRQYVRVRFWGRSVRGTDDTAWVASAFPKSLAAEALIVASALPAPAYPPSTPFAVQVEGESLTIPGRIYSAEPGSTTLPESPIVRTMTACLYTRHHDGIVRQRLLTDVLSNQAPWTVPFVVQLSGEYVIEIIEQILASAHSWTESERAIVGEFLSANPTYFRRTQSRVVSYWTCYHRGRWPRLATYPGQVLMSEFDGMLNTSTRLGT